MHLLFKNEPDFKHHIASVKARQGIGKDYDRVYEYSEPESYPCMMIYDVNRDYFGERSWCLLEFIYPSDFA